MVYRFRQDQELMETVMADGRVTNQDIAVELGRLSATVESLANKVDHNCEVSEKGDEKICKKIDDVSEDFKGRMERHRQYHKENEEKWGIFAYMRNNMKKTIIVTLLIGVLLATAFGLTANEVMAWVKKVNMFLP